MNNNNPKKFNIYGFSRYRDAPPSCSICHAVLIKNPKEPAQLMCPICGLVSNEQQIQKIEDENNKPELTPKVNPVNHRPSVMQSSKNIRTRKKKLYDEFGNEINQQDADIMNDIAQGRKVLYYKETVYNDTKAKSHKDKDGNDVYVTRK